MATLKYLGDMKSKYLLVFLFVLIVEFAYSQETKTMSTLFIKADDSLEWNRKEQTILANGNAKVHNEEMEIQAAKIIAKYEGEIKDNKFKLISAYKGFWKNKDIIVNGEKINYDIYKQEVYVIGEKISVSSKSDKIFCNKKINYIKLKNILEASGNCIVEMKNNQKLSANNISASIDQNGEILKFSANGLVNVFLNEDLKSVRANQAEYNKVSSTIYLEGNIELLVGSSYLKGDKAKINIKTGLAQVFSDQDKNVTGLIKN